MSTIAHPKPSRFNWRAYAGLLRWRLLLLGFVYVYNAFPGPRQLIKARQSLPTPAWMEWMTVPPATITADYASMVSFATWAVALPALLGFSLAMIIRPALQWRLALVLPHARQQLLGCHGVVLTGLALVCATIATRFDPTTPAPATFAIALAALSLSLPIGERNTRRAQLASGGGVALCALGLWFAPEMRQLSQLQPVVVIVAGLTASFLYYRASLSPARSADGLVSEPVDVLQGHAAAQQSRQRTLWGKPSFRGRDWRFAAVGESTFAWLRVGWHERMGQHRWTTLFSQNALLLGIATGVVVVAVRQLGIPSSSGREAAAVIYALICDPSRVGHSVSGLIAVMVSVFFLVGTVFMPLPRLNHVYVLSRTRRANWAQLSAAVHTAILFAAFTAAGLAVGAIAAIIADVPFRPAVPLFVRAMLGALPFVPLWQWYAFAELTDAPLVSKGFAILGFIGAFALACCAAMTTQPFAGLFLLLAVGIVLSQALFAGALRHLYRTADFATADGRSG